MSGNKERAVIIYCTKCNEKRTYWRMHAENGDEIGWINLPEFLKFQRRTDKVCLKGYPKQLIFLKIRESLNKIVVFKCNNCNELVYHNTNKWWSIIQYALDYATFLEDSNLI